MLPFSCFAFDWTVCANLDVIKVEYDILSLASHLQMQYCSASFDSCPIMLSSLRCTGDMLPCTSISSRGSRHTIEKPNGLDLLRIVPKMTVWDWSKDC